MALRANAAAIVVGISLPALADPPTLQIQQQATLDAAGVVVTVVANCGDGASAALVVVMVRQGNETGEGVLQFASRHVVLELVNAVCVAGLNRRMISIFAYGLTCLQEHVAQLLVRNTLFP